MASDAELRYYICSGTLQFSNPDIGSWVIRTIQLILDRSFQCSRRLRVPLSGVFITVRTTWHWLLSICKCYSTSWFDAHFLHWCTNHNSSHEARYSWCEYLL